MHEPLLAIRSSHAQDNRTVPSHKIAQTHRMCGESCCTICCTDVSHARQQLYVTVRYNGAKDHAAGESILKLSNAPILMQHMAWHSAMLSPESTVCSISKTPQEAAGSACLSCELAFRLRCAIGGSACFLGS